MAKPKAKRKPAAKPPVVRMVDKIVMRRVDDLVPYARNARTHSKAQVDQIAKAIVEYGFRNPLLIDGDSGIIAGHGRVLALKKLGVVEVATIDGSDMTPEQRRAYVLADNKLALNAGWDDELLSLELADLADAGFDLALTGFSEKELINLGVGGLGDGGDAGDETPPSSWAVIVECADEAQQVELIERLQAEGLTVKGSIA